MTFLVNSIFYTVQGEGGWSGRPAVFVRFSRCNLWSGREEDRATAVCKFCDTDFTHADRVELADIVEQVLAVARDCRFLVFTGGEPSLQINQSLVDALHEQGFYLAVETNGTMALKAELDWVCVSPKTGSTLVLDWGDELKLVYPQSIDPGVFEGLKFTHFWLSPMAGPNYEKNLADAIDYCLARPQWRLNTQIHKQIGVA